MASPLPYTWQKKQNHGKTFNSVQMPNMLGSKSEIARDRLLQPSTNRIAALTRATPAICQSHLFHRWAKSPAYTAHRTRTRTYLNPQHTAAHAAIDVRSRHITNPRSTRFVPARPVNIDDGPQSILWIRCLGDKRLPTASYALRPNLNFLFYFWPSERDRDFLPFVFYTPAALFFVNCY